MMHRVWIVNTEKPYKTAIHGRAITGMLSMMRIKFDSIAHSFIYLPNANKESKEKQNELWSQLQASPAFRFLHHVPFVLSSTVPRETFP